jgi:hypothetical protein
VSTKQVGKQKKIRGIYIYPLQVRKKTGGVYTRPFIIFLSNRYSNRVYNRPYGIYIQDLAGLGQLNTIIFKNQNQGGQFGATDFS